MDKFRCRALSPSCDSLPLKAAILSCALLLISGCGGGTGGSGTPPQQVQVTVNGNNSVRLGATTQLTATVINTMNTAVTWQVNAIAGGSSPTGTISAAGLYTPPTNIPNPNTVTVTAVSQASSTASGSLTESILNPVPVVTSATANLTGGTNYLLDVEGSGFVGGSQIEVAGQTLTTNYISSTDLQAAITEPAGTTTVAVTVVNPDPGTTTSASVNAAVLQTTATAAARLLDQATFGLTMADIQHVQQIGLNAYLAEQFNTPTTKLPDIANPPPAACSNTVVPCEESEWWQTVLTGPDQLRQRVAFALSQLFVISSDTVNGRAVTPYANMLANDAFGNFFTIMHDVSLSPGMGAYLNMLDSNVAPAGQIANENYPRELMQLFTIGLAELNPDGTTQLNGGNPVPTYTQLQVQAFARAYTGWTYATASGGSPANYPNNTPNYDDPMAAVESHHDTTSKILLNGTVLAAGQSAEQDLDDALTNIFNHPNVGPFVCRQLIQHLVTSTPSPAYVARAAVVFANDGTGVRGNMQAVVRAILLDQEARAGDTDATYDGGHLREPILWMTDVLRGLGYTNTDPNGYYNSLSNYSNTLGEIPYRSSSVFNFYPPSYVIPATTLNAPEFGLENTASAILRLTLANNFVANKISGFNVDLSATGTLGQLAASNPGTLVDTLGLLFMHGQMPVQMRTNILNHVSTLSDPAQRVRVAVYLVISSSQYKILH
jgi:uncharacterized protein (DUF1800 family)